MDATVKTWLSMSQKELDQIYANASSGTVPTGNTFGTAIWAGSIIAKPFAFIARIFVWQGKFFTLFEPENDKGTLANKVTPFGMHLIIARVSVGKSWMDDKGTIVIDYSNTSLLAKKIRDEIREVEPGVYLGKVWWGKTAFFHFALSLNK